MITISIILGLVFMGFTFYFMLVDDKRPEDSPIAQYLLQHVGGIGFWIVITMLLTPFLCGLVILSISVFRLIDINEAPTTYNACYQFHQLP